MDIKKVLEFYPLRISITDFCNLHCFFCSNEGMDSSQKNSRNIEVEQLEYLVDALHKSGLKNISITGGEPTAHPKIKKILKFLNKYKFNNFFFHTNGINLSKEITNLLSIGCNKIAVSLHAVDFETWHRLTGGRIAEFRKLMKNLEYLAYVKKNVNKKLTIEIKLVPIGGVNDSKQQIKSFLDFCSENNFKFKVLNFEPISKEQLKFSIPYKKIIGLFVGCGCKEAPMEKGFRGQAKYLPTKKYFYKKTYGVIIEIGCGSKKACRECHLSNEVFVDPAFNIKPCHVSEKTIALAEFIKSKEIGKIEEALVESRMFLKEAPGLGAETWNDDLSI
ncbi:MAG: radical SAM protein [Candidatus Falkowbacteria bacterium]|nr:radical SAM protein [Candidatus Falkowbacteria bacterium]